MRCGVVGAGNWARSALIPALRAQRGCELVACAAANLEEAKGLARDEGIRRPFAHLDEMLSDQDRPELIVLATPDHVHAEGVTAALQAGVAVYCEKPLANDAKTALELAALAQATAIPATVGYSFRFNPAIQALHRDLKAGRLGRPWLIELAEHNPQFHPKSGKPMNWKGDPAQAGGGALFEYGSHVVDLAIWLLGPIRRVTANLQRVLAGARLDDIATLQFEFESGVAGTLVASWVLDGGFPGIRIRLHGSKALAEVWVDDRIEDGQRYRVTRPFESTGDDEPLEAMGDLRSDAARRHIADFVASVRGQPTAHPGTLPSLDEGARVQQVLEAALQGTERWVKLAPA
jgi:predicted dehydrogenase